MLTYTPGDVGLVSRIIESVIAPLLVAALTYFVFGKLDELKRRREQSRLGVAVLCTFEEEVKNGLNIMEGVLNDGVIPNHLPHKSWLGINTISDTVLIRILEVTEGSAVIGFPASEIRIHTKNYFDHMVTNWDKVIELYQTGQQYILYAKHLRSYPEAARGVLDMLENTRKLLKNNASRIWPK